VPIENSTALEISALTDKMCEVRRSATNSVENQIDDVIFKLDEATRNVPGSPNIPMTIFDKIIKSDIFICDLTTINTNATDIQRKTPNPNVLIELGFAISQLGWHRIIMLFLTSHTKQHTKNII